MLSREVTTLECVHHPNILRLFEVVETLGRVHLVTEWIRGGELYNRITQGGSFKESQAAPLYKQLLLAVKHMHNLGFVHRDIKAENVLLVTEDRIKLADFGFSTQLLNGSQQHLDTFCGSPPYAAPELFSDDHYIGGPVDVWALGILIYFMIVGNMPFRAPTVPALRAAVLKGDFCLPTHLSLPCTRLIQRILVHTPSRRPTIDQLLNSQWVNLNALVNLPLDNINIVPKVKPKKARWFSKKRHLGRSTYASGGRQHLNEMSNLAPIQCNTKRASSILADNFLMPIDNNNSTINNADNLLVNHVNNNNNNNNNNNDSSIKTQRKSALFSGTLKKKIGPMEVKEKGKMFNKNSLEIKSLEIIGDLDKGGGGGGGGGRSEGVGSLDTNELIQQISKNYMAFDQEEGDFIMTPTFTNDDTHLHPLELEARTILQNLGVTSEMICKSIDSGPRSDIIGAYRIVVHRLQKQALLAKQIEIINKEETIRPKTNRTCAIL